MKRAPKSEIQQKPTPPSAIEKGFEDLRPRRDAFPTVSPRWLLMAGGVAVFGALACTWLTLCLLYWQGSWQLLYHPKLAISRTPATVKLEFEPIRFATTETGTPQLAGWWIPASDAHARFTMLYLHGADGNVSDAMDTLAKLHDQGLSVLAFDYRGYGQSLPIASAGRPNEKKLLQDAEWALDYLTQTRRINPVGIVVYGEGLGADLAAELAEHHSSLAGVILAEPPSEPMEMVFADPRSRLIPARLLVSDRYDVRAAAAQLRIPSLWLLAQPADGKTVQPPGYQADEFAKTLAWLNQPGAGDPHFAETLRRWLDELPSPAK